MTWFSFIQSRYAYFYLKLCVIPFFYLHFTLIFLICSLFFHSFIFLPSLFYNFACLTYFNNSSLFYLSSLYSFLSSFLSILFSLLLSNSEVCFPYVHPLRLNPISLWEFPWEVFIVSRNHSWFCNHSISSHLLLFHSPPSVIKDSFIILLSPIFFHLYPHLQKGHQWCPWVAFGDGALERATS